MKRFHMLLAAVALVVVAAGTGYAAIPASDGTISACQGGKGALRVIDAEAGETCEADQRLVTWNQHGPAATSGREIITSDNLESDAAALKSAHAYCPAGKVVVGGGATVYAINADGSYGFAHGIAVTGSAPIDEVSGSSGWFALARVVDSTTAEAAWKLTAYAICVTAA